MVLNYNIKIKHDHYLQICFIWQKQSSTEWITNDDFYNTLNSALAIRNYVSTYWHKSGKKWIKIHIKPDFGKFWWNVDFAYS